MSCRTLPARALVLLAALAPVVPVAAQNPTLQRLATLVGDWSLVDAEGDPIGMRATYRVIGGGSAVAETLFAGTPQETVTIYHREKMRVTATRISARGRPARLVPGESRDADTLRFEAAQAEGTEGGEGREKDAATEPRLTAVQLILADEQHVRIEWSWVGGDGKPTSRTIELRREARVTELAGEVARLRVRLESLERELDRRLKHEVTVKRRGEPNKVLLETRTLPPGPGWNVSGVPFRLAVHEDTIRYATTFASKGDAGMTVAHYGFRAGPGCQLRFSVLGGHGYIAVVEETRAPPRRIRSIPEFDVKLGAGTYGVVAHRVSGPRAKHPRSVVWDLSRFAGKAMRLYVVDAASDHYGQIGIGGVSIVEDAPK